VREKCPEGEIKVNARDHVIDFGIEYIKKEQFFYSFQISYLHMSTYL
jgi:hypothetical protein